MAWSGVLSLSDAAWVGFCGRGSPAHSEVMVDRSRLPLNKSGDKLFLTIDGECISEYAFVASLPAYRRITRNLEQLHIVVKRANLLTGRSTRMLAAEMSTVPYLVLDHKPTIFRSVVFCNFLSGNQS